MFAALALQLAYGFAYAPQLGIIGVRLVLAFIAVAQHLVVHTRGVANTQHPHTALHQFLANPVDCHIRLCTHKHLRLAVERLGNCFYERGGFSGARRSVHYHHIAAGKYVVHCHFLAAV